jgi:putative endonuclease
MKKSYYVYILASKRNGTLYVGTTNDLLRRIYEHKNKSIEGFTKKYNVNILVHYEETDDVSIALSREKEIKGWLREKKLKLIEENNPKWKDLSDGGFE